VYDHLKRKLLDTYYLGNSLVEKARLLKENDTKYSDKVSNIEGYLLEKISQGDAIAYALYYIEHEQVLSRIENAIYDDIEDFLGFSNSIAITEEQAIDPFFDTKVEYIATKLVGIHEL
jgi:hypothetical protein